MHPRLVVLNAGQGDAMIAHNPATGEAMVIDCAASGVIEAVAYLQTHEISKLAALLVTHLDDDHYGGVPELLRNVPAHTLSYGIAKGYKHAHTSVNAFLRAMLRHHASGVSSITRPYDGDTISVPGLELQIFGPTPIEETTALARNNANFASTMLRASIGDLTVLMAGDCPPWRWDRAVADHGQNLDADVFIVPHHGAAHTPQPHSLTAILDLVNPRVVVVSVGSYNRYGHPRPTTLDAVSGWVLAHGARLVCTQLNELCRAGNAGKGAAGVRCGGTVVVEHDGFGPVVTPMAADHLAFVRGLTAPRCV